MMPLETKTACPRCSIGTTLIFGDHCCIVCVSIPDAQAALLKEIQEKRERAETVATGYALNMGRLESALQSIEEYVDNHVDVDWEGRPNWAMDIKVMLDKLT